MAKVVHMGRLTQNQQIDLAISSISSVWFLSFDPKILSAK